MNLAQLYEESHLPKRVYDSVIEILRNDQAKELYSLLRKQYLLNKVVAIEMVRHDHFKVATIIARELIANNRYAEATEIAIALVKKNQFNLAGDLANDLNDRDSKYAEEIRSHLNPPANTPNKCCTIL